MEIDFEQKLRVLEDESKRLFFNRVLNAVEDQENEITDLTEKNILRKARIILAKKLSMNIKELEQAVDQLHQANQKAVDDLKQIADVKERTKRPRIENERVGEIILRKKK
jgi:hypothetical protein